LHNVNTECGYSSPLADPDSASIQEAAELGRDLEQAVPRTRQVVELGVVRPKSIRKQESPQIEREKQSGM